MERRATPNRPWLKWCLIALGWTMFGLFFASESVVSRAYGGRSLNLANTITSWLICSYIWLAATPLILTAAKRFPIERRVWVKHGLIHLALSFVFATVLLAVYVLLASLAGLEPSKYSYPLAFRNQFIESFHAEVLTYWAVIGLTHALSYYRKYRERELRASQLEAQLARAQLDALRSQLQPHFLFNTLNTISVLMREDVALANRLLMRLSDLLRLALKNTNAHEVSLREELEFLNSFLDIEQTRFPDRLTVKMQVQPETYEAQVPNLILQPLVENAIRYAVAPCPTRSTIEIKAARLNGQVELEVSDDGPGIDDFTKASLKGIGISNTRSRLEKLYGPAQSFDLLPGEGGGLRVRIRIPFHTADITARN